MRTLLFVLVATFAAAPAFAQGMGTGIPLNQEREVSPEQALKRRQTEEAYRSAIKRIPDAKPNDPWGNMRSVDTTTGNAAAKGKQPAKKAN
jgi:hypothetical protein